MIPHDPPGVWLAVTSLSFDISVLELLWTLTRGFEVVIHAEPDAHAGRAPSIGASRPLRKLDFSLFYFWGSDDAQGSDKYRLCSRARASPTPRLPRRLDARAPLPRLRRPVPESVGDERGDRRDHASASQIRAGSCVLPLHHPIRVAEDWAVVDNLSNGRVGDLVRRGLAAERLRAPARRTSRTPRDRCSA